MHCLLQLTYVCQSWRKPNWSSGYIKKQAESTSAEYNESIKNCKWVSCCRLSYWSDYSSSVDLSLLARRALCYKQEVSKFLLPQQNSSCTHYSMSIQLLYFLVEIVCRPLTGNCSTFSASFCVHPLLLDTLVLNLLWSLNPNSGNPSCSPNFIWACAWFSGEMLIWT
jgi:hypothetical protein